jgi:hypothetical protein
MNNLNKPIIEPVPELVADTRKFCEIRFDCLVTMHDVVFARYKGMLGNEKQSKVPQWFKAQYALTLESIKYMDEYQIGSQIKQMFRELEHTINKYQNQ